MVAYLYIKRVERWKSIQRFVEKLTGRKPLAFADSNKFPRFCFFFCASGCRARFSKVDIDSRKTERGALARSWNRGIKNSWNTAHPVCCVEDLWKQGPQDSRIRGMKATAKPKIYGWNRFTQLHFSRFARMWFTRRSCEKSLDAQRTAESSTRNEIKKKKKNK